LIDYEQWCNMPAIETSSEPQEATV